MTTILQQAQNDIDNLTKALAGLRSRQSNTQAGLVGKVGTPEFTALATEANALETQAIATEAALEAARERLKQETERQKSPEYKANLKALDELQRDSERKVKAIRDGARELIRLAGELSAIEKKYYVTAKNVGGWLSPHLDRKSENTQAKLMTDKLTLLLEGWDGLDLNTSLKGNYANAVHPKKEPISERAKALKEHYPEPKG